MISYGCTGKRRYSTYTDAGRVAKLVSRHKDARMLPYHCNRCGGFHIAERFREIGRRPKRQHEACAE